MYPFSRQITQRPQLSRLHDIDGMPPLLRRIFENRNVQGAEELDNSLGRLHPPQNMKGMAEATALLHRAIDEGWNILIVGDHDADGATATAVAMLGLHAMGAAAVDYLVPNRFDHGYGLSPAIAAMAIERGPQLVVTVDNGITATDGVAALSAAGVAVLITDHHLPDAELPAADAIVNPNQPGCPFPSKMLAGVGVMFYVLMALRQRLRAADHPGGNINLAELLDLVAIGTVADLVPLDHNNRILVSQGLARIRGRRSRPGVQAICGVARRRPEQFTASDLGFVISPRLNAAGRMDDISTGIECLLAERGAAATYANALHAMNSERRRLQRTMQQQATEIVASLQGGPSERSPHGIVVYDPGWHPGVVGLVASHLMGRHNRPAAAFAAAAGGRIRGSVRSVAGLHIRDLLERMATRDPDLLESFGGHAMAAGVTLREAQLETFADSFRELAGEHFSQHPPPDEILTDGPLGATDFNMQTADLIRHAAPWGQHFPAPLFDGEFRVLAYRVVGDRHMKMRLQPPYDIPPLSAIAFGYTQPGADVVPPAGEVHAAYGLEINEFNGTRTLQLRVEYMQSA